MCGRYTLRTDGERMVEAFKAEPGDLFEHRPRYNIAPSQPVPAVRAGKGSASRRLDLLRWGLVPFWADDPTIGTRMINARADTAATKPAYKAAMRYRRCLLPADGFYEWAKSSGASGDSGGKKQPYYVRMADGSLFAFAGLWEHWQDANGNELESCTILTTEPNETVRPLHNRMPAILSPDAYATWLDPNQQDAKEAASLLQASPAADMEAYPVGLHVNRPQHDDPQCIEPVESLF